MSDRVAVVGCERYVFIRCLTGDDYARRMRGCMARHAFKLEGHIDELFHLRVRIVARLQLPGDGKRLGQRHFRLHRHQLGNTVHRAVGHVQNAAYVADGSTRRHRTEGHDLRHMVGAVLADHIVDDLLTALVTEIDVKVRHRDALRVQEAFKQQIVLDGVDIGDTYTVGRKASRTGAASRAHGDPLAFRIVDEIEHNQIIVDIPHAVNNGYLVVQPDAYILRHVRTVPPQQTVPAQLYKILFVVHAVRRHKIRQLCHAEFKIKAAHLCDSARVFTGFGPCAEQLVHLVVAFDVELIRAEFQYVIVIHRLVCLDANENVLHPGIFFFKIVGVVGGDQRNACFPGKPHKQRQHRALLVQPMVLYLNIIVSFAEQIFIVPRKILGFFIIPCQ